MGAFLLIALMVTDCSGLSRKRRLPECKALYELIQSDWSRDANAGLYRMKHDPKARLTHNMIAGQDCLKGLRQSDIEKLLGKPDTIYRGHSAYFIMEPCLGPRGISENGCTYIECIFGGEGTVTAVQVVSCSVKE